MTVSRMKGPKGKADRLCSQLVRSRGACQKCGSTRDLQAAHIISRRFSATRSDERNLWCLCAKCHRRFHDHPDEHMAFVASTIGLDLFRELKERALTNPRPWKDSDWQAEAARLEALLKAAA